MLGSYNIVVENAYLKYEFKINRNKILWCMMTYILM